MLLKTARCIAVSMAGMALANVAWAQDANVTTGAKSAKLGGEFRGEFLYSDHGLLKTDGGDDPDATSEIQVQAVKIKLHGNINDNTEYGFRFNLLHPVQGPLDYGYGTHWLNKMVGFSVGKMKVVQGGWDTWNASYRDHAGGAYAEHLAYGEYEDMIALHFNVAGRIDLQILNDKTTATGGEWNTTAHPTWALGWRGEFGAIKPIVELGSYDNNKSMWYDLGIATEMNGLSASLDYDAQSVAHKGADTDGKAKAVTDMSTAITLNVAYSVKNSVTPWLYFSTFDNKQADDDDNGSKDVKYNPVIAPDADGNIEPSFSDNGQTLGLGVNFDSFGKGWTPYVALVSTSGKFQKSATEDKSESKSEMNVKLGVLGEL